MRAASLRTLLLAVAAVLLAGSALAQSGLDSSGEGDLQHRAGLRVGTTEGTADVVNDGEVQLAWSFDRHTGEAAAGEYAATFYFAQAAETGISRLGGAEVRASPEGILLPTLSGAVGESQHVVDESSSSLRVTYHCQRAGTAEVRLRVPVLGHKTLLWFWRKTCGSAVRETLSVGFNGTAAAVVKAGVVSPSWRSGASQRLPAAQSSVSFAVSMTALGGAQRFERARVTAGGAAIASATVVGAFANDTTTVPAGGQAQLSVLVECLQAGTATISVTLPAAPRFDPYAPLSWSWTHECGNAARPGLLISTTVSSATAPVQRAAANVVRDGAVLPAWREFNTVVQQAHINYTFWVALQQSGGAQAFDEPQVAAWPPVATPIVQNERGVELVGGGGSAVGGRWTPLTVAFNCNSTKRQVVKMVLTLPMAAYHKLDIHFLHACGGFKPGVTIDYAAGSELPVVEAEEGEQAAAEQASNSSSSLRGSEAAAGEAGEAGEAAGGGAAGSNSTADAAASQDGGDGDAVKLSACVKDSLALPGWKPSDLQSDARLADGSEAFTVFYAHFHNPTSPAAGGLQTVGAPVVRALAEDGSAADFVKLTVTGNLTGGGSFAVGQPGRLRVAYDCPKLAFFPSLLSSGWSGRDASVDVVIPMQQPSFAPVHYRYTKRCRGWLTTPIGIVVGLIAAAALAFLLVRVAKNGVSSLKVDVAMPAMPSFNYSALSGGGGDGDAAGDVETGDGSAAAAEGKGKKGKKSKKGKKGKKGKKSKKDKKGKKGKKGKKKGKKGKKGKKSAEPEEAGLLAFADEDMVV